MSGQLHRAIPFCPAPFVCGKTDKRGGPTRDGPDPSGPFCVRADPFRAQTCAGFGSRRTPNGRALVRIEAAWQAATYLPPIHINAHERAAPPVIRTSNGSPSFFKWEAWTGRRPHCPTPPRGLLETDSGDHVPKP